MHCAGLMYLRLPLNTATAGYNRSAALWIAMFAFTLMPSETAVSVWCQERAVVGSSSVCTPLRCPALHESPHVACDQDKGGCYHESTVQHYCRADYIEPSHILTLPICL